MERIMVCTQSGTQDASNFSKNDYDLDSIARAHSGNPDEFRARVSNVSNGVKILYIAFAIVC
jgi:hypothetical protein